MAPNQHHKLTSSVEHPSGVARVSVMPVLVVEKASAVARVSVMPVLVVEQAS